MLNGKQIREVTAQGIRYIDENNVEQFIDFAQCYENYISERLSPENWEFHKKWNHKTDTDWDEYVASIKSHKEVGKRNITDLTLKFFTDPSLKFEFDNLDDWHKVIGLIRRARYHTIDMT
jgi:hypothetical protein